MKALECHLRDLPETTTSERIYKEHLLQEFDLMMKIINPKWDSLAVDFNNRELCKKL